MMSESKKRRSKTYCCVVNCGNSYEKSLDGTRFFSFPARAYLAERRQIWINKVNRQNADGSMWQPKPYSRICSDHFVGGVKSEHPLSPSYNPSIFPAAYKKENPDEKLAIGGFKRVGTQGMSLDPNLTGLDVKPFEHLDLIPSEPLDVKPSEPIDVRPSDPLDVKSSEPIDVKPFDPLDVRLFEPLVKDAETYVNFVSERSNSKSVTYYIREKVGDVCDAGIEIFIPDSDKPTIGVHRRGTVSTACGPGQVTTYVDRSIGPDNMESLPNTCSQCVGFHGYSSLSTDEEFLDLGGVTINVFHLLLKRLDDVATSKVSIENRLLIFLFKMKCNLSYSAIGALFKVQQTTVASIFISMLKNLKNTCQNYIFWPSRETNESLIPESFKQNYPRCRVIINCAEIKIEQPQDVHQRAFMYSHYKSGFTLKFLVCVAPFSSVTFVSKAYGGRATDTFIITDSGFLDLIEPGDIILADNGFPDLQSTLDEAGKGGIVVTPPFVHEDRLTKDEIDLCYSVAKVRMDVERIIQRIKIFQILTKLPSNLIVHADDVMFMCCVLANLQSPINAKVAQKHSSCPKGTELSAN